MIPPSEKQVAFLHTLTTPEKVAEILAAGYSRKTISPVIDKLVAERKIAQQAEWAAKPKAQPGYYTLADKVYEVVPTKDGQRVYAMELVIYTDAKGAKRGRWEYRKGVANDLACIRPMSKEQAAKLGHLHGVCVICGATLTDPKSVEAGVGPICLEKL